jgi:hypothetical protein
VRATLSAPINRSWRHLHEHLGASNTVVGSLCGLLRSVRSDAWSCSGFMYLVGLASHSPLATNGLSTPLTTYILIRLSAPRDSFYMGLLLVWSVHSRTSKFSESTIITDSMQARLIQPTASTMRRHRIQFTLTLRSVIYKFL